MNQQPASINPVQRARIWYGLLLLVIGIFAVRVFYLQVIRYDYYKQAARSDQLKQYVVPAERGIITAHLGDQTVPIVLNQKLYTLYADPQVVKDAGAAAAKLQPIIGGDVPAIQKELTRPITRYVVLGKKLTPTQAKAILGFKLPGIGTLEQDYRTYPQGALAAQVLGFVNDDGKGVYGIEQAMNKQLAGTPGQLKAVTDINGVPLAATGGNLSTAPVAGSNLGLTIDVGMQAGLEKIVKAAQDKYKTKTTSAVIMDVRSGAVKAMANYPSFDPANYQAVDDAALFNNATVTTPIEPGSVTKIFTTATALDKGAVGPNTSFYDPGYWDVDGTRIADVEQDHSTGQQTILSTLDKSLNTGAIWMLMQLGGGEINAKGRGTLYDYFANHFGLGRATGIEQGNGEEASGTVLPPTDNGAGIDLTYANMSFGQAYTATALQLAAGISSIVNGGTYYQPHLVDKVTDGSGKTVTTEPHKLREHVVSAQTSQDVVSLLEQNNTNHIHEGFGYLNFGPNYSVGGKTGTAEIANPDGGYYSDRANGTYAGFVGGDSPEYVIVVYNFEPTKYGGFAGAQTGQPVFGDIVHMLINDFGVTPKR